MDPLRCCMLHDRLYNLLLSIETKMWYRHMIRRRELVPSHWIAIPQGSISDLFLILFDPIPFLTHVFDDYTSVVVKVPKDNKILKIEHLKTF